MGVTRRTYFGSLRSTFTGRRPYWSVPRPGCYSEAKGICKDVLNVPRNSQCPFGNNESSPEVYRIGCQLSLPETKQEAHTR